MPKAIVTYVRIVDAFNRGVGRVAMYLLIAMMAILLWSSFSKVFLLPSLWTLEMAQFAMVAYFILGGPYALQLGGHVRMDLFYGSWSDRTRAWVDAFTVIFLITYLVILLYGGIESTIYALKYSERSPTAWRPYMSPIKILISIGIFMMLLQATVAFLKDVARLRGEEL
ncbi:TRAP-type C4-dicarboxylate transport system, small permease component [hydrothermal vent metagenome]|uniref:TRAP-type C4-dicarboxylate transport system, small permease component n=1 Tax=hydrothermal vent metagenome TaxID=652676 RepID=A0A3B0T3H0_9ZZZZ